MDVVSSELEVVRTGETLILAPNITGLQLPSTVQAGTIQSMQDYTDSENIQVKPLCREFACNRRLGCPADMAVEDEIQPSAKPDTATARAERAQRRNAASITVSVKDVQDFVDEIDVHVVYIQCVQETCKKVWSRLPETRQVMDETEKAMKHYNDTVDEFLDGTEADNEANRETAAPVTAAALQSIKTAAEPLVKQSSELREVIDKEKSRLKVVVGSLVQSWERGCDSCLLYTLSAIFIASFVWFFIGVFQELWEAETAPPGGWDGDLGDLEPPEAAVISDEF